MASSSRDAFLQIIEAQPHISNRFTKLARVGCNGGDGNFSLVVSALDQKTGRKIALKFYDPDHATDAYRSNCFRREVDMLAHFVGAPDILQCVTPMDSFSVSLFHGSITMPISFSFYGVELASASVAERLPHAHWTAIQKLDAFRAMCRAVQRIHATGVIHRDIKLSNYLVMHDGAIRLADFGTARFLNDTSLLSQSYSMPVGHLEHAAPEIFANLQDADPEINFKGDIYSLGTALFELLTGMVLNPLIIDQATLFDLSRTMNAVAARDRVRIYNSFVSGMAASRPLPGLSYLGVNIPQSVSGIVESLYQDLCALDYRRRLMDFGTMFSRLRRATIILNHEASYQAWRKKQMLYRERADAKRRRRDKHRREAA